MRESHPFVQKWPNFGEKGKILAKTEHFLAGFEVQGEILQKRMYLECAANAPTMTKKPTYLSHSLSLSLSLSPSSLSHSLSLCLFNVVLLVMSLLFAFECPTIFFSLSQFLLTLFRSIMSLNFSLSMCE